DGLNLMGWRGVAAVEGEVPQSFEPVHRRVLLEQHYLCARLHGPPPLVCVDHAGEAFQQSRLAGAVAADQRQPVARADEQVDAAEQPAVALDEAEIFISEYWCCHGGQIGGEIRSAKPSTSSSLRHKLGPGRGIRSTNCR